MIGKLAGIGKDLDLTALEAAHKEALKNQERIVIKAAVQAEKQKLQAKKAVFQSWLENEKDGLKTLTGTTLVSDLEAGLEGKAADSSKNFLTELPEPKLISPIGNF